MDRFDNVEKGTKSLEDILTTLQAILAKETPVAEAQVIPPFPTEMRISNFPKHVPVHIPEQIDNSALIQRGFADLGKVMEKYFTAQAEAKSEDSMKMDKMIEILGQIADKEDSTPGAVVSVRRPRTKWIIVSTSNGTLLGTMDGVNKDFLLPSRPVHNSESVRLNGQSIHLGDDYTINGVKISILVPLIDTDKIQVKFQQSP